ncbi:hypothetical protein QTP88_000331 [Uroleucon formosanum]
MKNICCQMCYLQFIDESVFVTYTITYISIGDCGVTINRYIPSIIKYLHVYSQIIMHLKVYLMNCCPKLISYV